MSEQPPFDPGKKDRSTIIPVDRKPVDFFDHELAAELGYEAQPSSSESSAVEPRISRQQEKHPTDFYDKDLARELGYDPDIMPSVPYER